MDKVKADTLVSELKLTGQSWETLVDSLTEKMPIDITGVSVDGGGILGIGSARFMSDLGYKGEQFLSGTSTGSIIVALRAIGREWPEILEIFRTEGAHIFENPGWLWKMNPQLPKYNEANIDAALKRHFGNKTMKSMNIPTFITASDFASGKPKVFDSITDQDVPIRYAVRCSTAAPTYFAPIDGRYADGGLWANNPALVGLAGYCNKTGLHPLRCRTLALGTGGDYWASRKIGKYMNALQWANPIISYSLGGTEEGATFIARALLGSRRFYRVEPKLTKDYALDAISSMNEYEELWGKFESQMHQDVWDWLLN